MPQNPKLFQHFAGTQTVFNFIGFWISDFEIRAAQRVAKCKADFSLFMTVLMSREKRSLSRLVQGVASAS
jgi:hypothetical protein